MRSPRWLMPAMGALGVVSAQENCQATITVTNLASSPSTAITSSSSSLSRQVITLTSYNTIVMTSHGREIEKTQAVTNVLLIGGAATRPLAASDSIGNRQAASCPPAVTVTLISQETGSTQYTTTSSSMEWPSTSSIDPTAGVSSSSPTSPLASTLSTRSMTEPSTTSNISSTFSSNMPSSTPGSSSNTVSNSSTSESSSKTGTIATSSQSGSASSPLESSSESKVPPSISTEPDATSDSSSGPTITSTSPSILPNTPSPGSGTIPNFSPSTSLSPSGIPIPPTGSSTGPPSSTLQSVTVMSGIDPNIWKSPSPTITCNVPCNLDLPCVMFDKPTTVTPPPYTTSLCKQHCDGLHFRTMTTITFPPITASSVCFYPMSAKSADTFTAAPNWFGGDNGLINITAPMALNTCPPHWPYTDSDGKCGPENHYLCPKKKCCGKDNKCGEGIDYCGDGCQLNWGYCWKNSTSCKMPKFGKARLQRCDIWKHLLTCLQDDDDDHPVPVFPIWFDAPDPPGPPPPINIKTGGITFPPPPDPCGVLGCKGVCGWISCEGIAGWFVKMIRIPKINCNLITKAFCRLLKLPCCKKKGGSDGSDDHDCDFCDPPEGSMLNGDTKVCDSNMENCDDLPEEDEEDEECTSTSTVTDQTVYCDLVTAADGKSSKDCASTKSKVRSGCTLGDANTVTTTSTDCESRTATQISELCQVITGTSTTRTECTKAVTKKVSGCSATPKTTSVFTTSCDETTATHISKMCSVATAANSTSTYCRTTSTNRESGCDVTGTTTTLFSTDCFSRTTVTDKTASCFAVGSTVVGGSTFIPSTTCTSTASTVYSGCELTGSTMTEVSTSFPACAASAQITIETMPTFASNMTNSTAPTCGPPTSTGIPECTKIVAGQYVVTEAIGDVSGSAFITARQEGDTSSASISCYCGPSAGADIWPVRVCGSETWCPNEATTAQEVTASPAPPTLPVTWS